MPLSSRLKQLAPPAPLPLASARPRRPAPCHTPSPGKRSGGATCGREAKWGERAPGWATGVGVSRVGDTSSGRRPGRGGAPGRAAQGCRPHAGLSSGRARGQDALALAPAPAPAPALAPALACGAGGGARAAMARRRSARRPLETRGPAPPGRRPAHSRQTPPWPAPRRGRSPRGCAARRRWRAPAHRAPLARLARPSRLRRQRATRGRRGTRPPPRPRRRRRRSGRDPHPARCRGPPPPPPPPADASCASPPASPPAAPPSPAPRPGLSPEWRSAFGGRGGAGRGGAVLVWRQTRGGCASG
jgi:hypothetical protein